MKQKRTKAEDTSFNPEEFESSSQAGTALKDPDTEVTPPADTQVNGKNFADKIQKKKFTPAPDPFGVEGIKAGDNHVHLAKSDTDHAWIIRFDQNPNQGEFTKENPHPVIAYLKSEGFRWGFSDADGKGGWGKLMREGHYTFAEHMDAQRVFRKAAEMLGAKEQGIPR